MLSLAPGWGNAHPNLGDALLQVGDAHGALPEIEQETSVGKMIGLPMAYHALGRKADSDAALAALIADAKFEGLPCDVDRIRLTVKREVNPA